ncbi:DUF4097 family beta strand repeat-containing protein [Sessilibacter sp. MAH4]
MLKLISTLLFAMPCLALAAGQSIEEKKSTGTSPRVEIQNAKGKINIESWDRPEVKVSGVLDEHAKEFIFEASENNVRILVESQQHSGRSSGSILTVFLPEQAQISAEGTATDFIINKIQGDIKLETVSGDVRISGNRARLDIDTVSGDIGVMDHEGLVFIESVSGDISYDGLATRMEIESIQGDIDVNNQGKLSEAEFSSVSGDIETKTYTGNDRLSLEWSAVSGDIDVSFLDSVNASFEIETMNGNIKNFFTEDKADQKRWLGSSLTFNSGSPTGEISISTVSGNISIK